ncbi:MAG: DUF1667 domain-containing protein [Bacilli bacterium]|nr:DUF1667 domain-containing protein [Bacilli bacterium]
MKKEMICIVCPNSCRLLTSFDDGVLKVEGAKCKRGIEFAQNEIQNPKRGLCTTVRTKVSGHLLTSVRTSKEVDKDMIFPIMEELRTFVLNKKVQIGETIISNILDTGVDIIATGEME